MATTTTNQVETVGWSPKAVAAIVTSAASTVVVGLVAKYAGAHIEVGTVGAILGPSLVGVLTGLAARQAKAGLVTVDTDEA